MLIINCIATGFSKLIIRNLKYPIVLLKGQFLIELLNHAWRNLKQDHKVSVFIFGQQDHELGSYQYLFMNTVSIKYLAIYIYSWTTGLRRTCIYSWTTGLRSTFINSWTTGLRINAGTS